MSMIRPNGHKDDPPPSRGLKRAVGVIIRHYAKADAAQVGYLAMLALRENAGWPLECIGYVFQPSQGPHQPLHDPRETGTARQVFSPPSASASATPTTTNNSPPDPQSPASSPRKSAPSTKPANPIPEAGLFQPTTSNHSTTTP